MILHSIQVWERKKTRNKRKQAYFWDFLTIPGTSHLQVVPFSRTILAPVLLDNSLKLKIRYLELRQSCPQAQKRWPCSSLPVLFFPPPPHDPLGLTQHWAHRGCSTNTCWWDRPLSPPLWHLTNDQPAIFDFSSGTGPFPFLNSLTDAVIHLDNLMRLLWPISPRIPEELYYLTPWLLPERKK